MYTLVNKTIGKSLSALAMLALVFGSFGFSLGYAAIAKADTGTVTVTINKYIEGAQATALTANNNDFPMFATYTIAGNAGGPSPYALSASGYNGDPTPYQASTAANLNTGDDYSTYEDTSNTAIVGSVCAEGTPFALVGYTSGDTLAQAQAATPSLTVPTFTGLTSDKYVIVWNHDCAISATPVPVTVTIEKFIDGAQATAVTANSADFPMTTTYTVNGTPGGPSAYNLSAGGYNGNPTPYQAMTSGLVTGDNFATNEVTGGAVVGADCTAEQPFSLVGYTTGDTLAAAAAGTPTTTAPAFTGLTSDKYVIVWNHDCANTSGTIGGDVSGGAPHGSLGVTAIDSTDTSATADGTFENGWKYTFHITVPNNETHLSMKFANWLNNVASSTIPVAGNMRISSAQASNPATVLLTAANTYSSPSLNMTGDLDPLTPGQQIEVLVEVAVPIGTINGSYTTSYGVQTLP